MINLTLAEARRIDPTRTRGLRKRFAAELRRRFRSLAAVLREKLDREESPTTAHWIGLQDRGTMQREFDEFVRTEIGRIILGEWLAAYVAEAYLAGAMSAWRKAGANGVPGDSPGDGLGVFLRALESRQAGRPETVRNAARKPPRRTGRLRGLKFSLPGTGSSAIYRDARGRFMSERVKLLSDRLRGEMRNATADMAQRISRALVDGLDRGLMPSTIGKTIAATVEGVGINRALMIAETEVVRAYAEGQLDGMAVLGVQQITAAVEWETTGNPCPLCAPMDGVVLTIDEARGMIPRHPRCKCAWKPVSAKAPGQKRQRNQIEKAINLSLKREGVGGEDDEIGGWGAGDDIARNRPKLNRAWIVLNGGRGSGNFGHRGRPGAVGGSGGTGLGAMPGASNPGGQSFPHKLSKVERRTAAALVVGLTAKLLGQRATYRTIARAKRLARRVAVSTAILIAEKGHKIYPEMLETAEDWNRLSNAKGFDPIAAQTGISANTAAVVLSHVLARARVYVGKKLTRNATFNDVQTAYDAAEFLSRLFAMVPELGRAPTAGQLLETMGSLR